MIIYPNSRIVLKESFDKHTSSLIKNVPLAHWKTVANIVFKHASIHEHIPKCVEREVSAEFRSPSSDSILIHHQKNWLHSAIKYFFMRLMSNAHSGQHLYTEPVVHHLRIKSLSVKTVRIAL